MLFRSSTPRHVRELIARCLVKSPRERLRDAGEARLALGRTDVADEPSEGRTATGRARTWAGGLVTGGVLASLAMLAFRGEPTSDSAAPRRVSVPLSPTPGLYDGATNTTNFAISPDGRTLVYSGRDELYRRDLAQLQWQPIPGTENAIDPMFSPDGSKIVFGSNRNAKNPRSTDVYIADWLENAFILD